MSVRMQALQGILIRVARRTAAKPFDPVGDRVRGAKLEKRIKAKRGVAETSVVLGGVPCRRFSSGGAARGVFFHLHGGGYTGGSSAVGRLYTGISVDRGPDVISVDYRLAPEHTYPASVDDALAAYRALLDTVPASKIVVGGESAGGNLTLVLVQRLIADGLPLPAAVVPVFPWSDLTQTSSSWSTNARRDILSKKTIDQCSLAYAGELALDDPLISPQFGSFAGFPSALIHVGTHDCLLDDARAVTASMKQAGVSVVLREVPGAVHGFTLLPMPESRAAMAEIRDFVLSYLPA